MDVSNFTDKAKEVIQSASNIAEKNKNSEIDIWHMILAMCERQNETVYQLLQKMEIDVASLVVKMQEEIESMNLPYAPCHELSMGMSNDYIKAIEEGSTCVRLGRIFLK